MPPKRPPNDAKPTGKKGKGPAGPSAPKPNLNERQVTRRYNYYQTYHQNVVDIIKYAFEQHLKIVMGVGMPVYNILYNMVFHSSTITRADAENDMGNEEDGEFPICVEKVNQLLPPDRYDHEDIVILCSIINFFVVFVESLSPEVNFTLEMLNKGVMTRDPNTNVLHFSQTGYNKHPTAARDFARTAMTDKKDIDEGLNEIIRITRHNVENVKKMIKDLDRDSPDTDSDEETL